MGMAYRFAPESRGTSSQVARDRPAAYILLGFSVIADDVSRFARTGGRSAEENSIWLSPPDAESDRRVAGREYGAVVRPDRAVLQSAPAGGEGDRRRRARRDQGIGPDPNGPVDARGNRRREAIRTIGCTSPIRRSACPRPSTRKGPLHAGVAPTGSAERDPVARANHPELKDSRIMRLVGTTKSTIQADRGRRRWTPPTSAARSGHPRLCSRIDLDWRSARGQGKAGFRWRRRARHSSRFRSHGAERSAAGAGARRPRNADDLDVEAAFAKLEQLGGGKGE